MTEEELRRLQSIEQKLTDFWIANDKHTEESKREILDKIRQLQVENEKNKFDLQEAIYGSKDFIGINTRQKIMEARLQIFWWCLAVVGSTVIALSITAIAKHFGVS